MHSNQDPRTKGHFVWPGKWRYYSLPIRIPDRRLPSVAPSAIFVSVEKGVRLEAEHEPGS